MKINAKPFENISDKNLSNANFDKGFVNSNNEANTAADNISIINEYALEGQMRKMQLLRKFAVNDASNISANLPSKFAVSTRRIGGDEDLIKELNRIHENYRRQIKPSEIKGAQPASSGLPSGHADSKHGVKVEVQATVMNTPDRIFSGINDNGRYVDIYYKDESVVITEFGNKGRVITAYGTISTKGKIEPVDVEQFISNPRYVEIKLEEKGATNIIYPNKQRWEADDFPRNPPKPNVPPKTNGGSNGGTVEGNNTPKTTVAGSGQKVPIANETPVGEVPITTEPPMTPRVLPEEVPIVKPSGGTTGTISNGIILLQLVQLGLAAYDVSRLKADGDKFGYYVDPFLNRYVLTDPDKAAKNLPEGFELKFFLDPTNVYPVGPSIMFKVQDGKFVNIDKNYPDYRLYIGEDGLVAAGVTV